MASRLITTGLSTVVITTALLAGPATAQPPAPTPSAPTTQLSPQSPGGGGGTEQIPVRDPATGGVRWDQFGGDPAEAPQDMDGFFESTLGWLRTFCAVAGVLGVLCCAFLTAIGFRGRSEAAKKALVSLPSVLLGTCMAGSAAAILTVFIV